jgi:hypothetical protein
VQGLPASGRAGPGPSWLLGTAPGRLCSPGRGRR